MGLHIDLEAVYLKNKAIMADPGHRKKFALKYGLLINIGDNYTKKEIEIKRRDNIRKFGLSCDYYGTLKPPKAKTKEWLKVLTLQQILKDRTRFSCAQKIHQLVILKIALKKKLKAALKFGKYK